MAVQLKYHCQITAIGGNHSSPPISASVVANLLGLWDAPGAEFPSILVHCLPNLKWNETWALKLQKQIWPRFGQADIIKGWGYNYYLFHQHERESELMLVLLFHSHIIIFGPQIWYTSCTPGREWSQQGITIIQVCVRHYAVNGGSEILASDWPSQFSFFLPFHQCESGKD